MEMKKSSYLILLFFCTIFSCKKETPSVQEVGYNIYNDSISKKKNRVKIFKLKRSIQEKTDEYPSFTSTIESIDSLNLAPFNKVAEISYILSEQLFEIPRELDSTLKTKGVLSRIAQMETYSSAISFETSKQNKDSVKINNHVIKVIESYNDLITQLNETSAKLPEEIKKQLEKTNNIKKDTIEGVPLF